MTKGKTHLGPVKRAGLEFGLGCGKSLKAMGRELGVSTSTLSREIRKHTYESFKGCYGRGNQCVHRATCTVHDICSDCPGSGSRCAACSYRHCYRICGKVEYIDCGKRGLRTAGVCNGCPDERRCHQRKLFYVAEHAQDDYRRTLKESREGAAIERGELDRIDGIVSPKIKDGQSMHHIYRTQPGLFNCNERTLSRYLHYGLFTAKRGDMKRSCTVRERKPKSGDYAHKVEKGCYQGRDFRTGEAFRREHPSLAVVYMDLVIGRPGGQCLMTLHWKDTGFMVAILIPNKCADNVVAVFDRLYGELGHEAFTRLFGVIITDRGTEFSNPSRIEFSKDGKRRTWVFFCDPMNSNQKSQEERNHELVREVLPKGVSFDGLTQEDASLMMSHVNAYVRLSQSDRTPYDVFEFIHGEGTAAKLGISKIDPKEVVLKPRLLGIEMK